MRGIKGFFGTLKKHVVQITGGLVKVSASIKKEALRKLDKSAAPLPNLGAKQEHEPRRRCGAC